MNNYIHILCLLCNIDLCWIKFYTAVYFFVTTYITIDDTNRLTYSQIPNNAMHSLNIRSSTFILTVRERIRCFATNSLALNLIDNNMKQVKSLKISDSPLALKSIGDQIWCCQSDGICVFGDTLHHLIHLKLGWTYDTSLLSQGHIVIAGEDGLRIVILNHVKWMIIQ